MIIPVMILSSCSGWEDYTTDFDYTAVYFAYQNQLRTIVAQESMSFEFGVYMAGRRENKSEEWVTYSIDPSLLENEEYVGDREFKLLPSDWYTLSSPDIFRIPEGSFLGTSVLTLDIGKFTSDPDTRDITYALPVRILDTSVDSVLVGSYSDEGSVIVAPKDYAIIAVKYINPYHGTYYLQGTRYIRNAVGEWEEDEVYTSKDLSAGRTADIETLSLTELSFPYAGGVEADSKNNVGLELTVGEDNLLTVEKAAGASDMIDFRNASGTYDPQTRTFALVYEYCIERDPEDGIPVLAEYRVEEKLIWRNTDIHFEQW